MRYRKNRAGNDISLLGYGLMRFTSKGTGIDIDKAEQEVLRAFDLGVNYYDTAYIYPGSEAAFGEILSRHPGMREQLLIATKLPQYLIRSEPSIEKYFNEQLSRLRTTYIDHYLMHMLTDVSAWENLVKLGIREWIDRKKAEGAIRQIGFSFHGNTEMFLKILDAYDWDFCQIQYNYIDEVSQAGRKGLQAAYEKGVPVIIMEGLRGGKLIDMLPEKAKALIEKDEKHRSAAELAFTWLYDQREVTCVLSGMNSVAMVEENCRIADKADAGCLDEADHALIDGIRDAINEKIKVPCTGCSYCMPCPQGVDIPGAFKYYNEMYTEKASSARRGYIQYAALRTVPAFPSRCVACGKCESHCPQHIEIIKELKAANKALLPLPYRAAAAVARRFVPF